MAWADPDDVQDEFLMYQEALSELDGTEGQRIKTSWDEMKLKGRG